MACKEVQQENKVTSAPEHVAIETGPTEALTLARSISDHLQRIHTFASQGNDDSLETANKALSEFLKNGSKKHPEWLDMDLPGTDTMSINVLTSEDRKARIYSWDTRLGGTMRFFYGVMQYKTSKGSDVKVLNDENSEEGDSGLMYRYLHTIKTSSGKVYYLVLYRGVYSTKDVVDGVAAFSIENDMINDTIKVFKAAKSELNSISYGYDFLSNIDENSGGQKNELHLDEKKTKLFIPVVDNKDNVTNRSLIYKFDGDKFVYDKNAH